MDFSYRRLLLLGGGFMGISLLWGIYNAYLPVMLQAGRADYSAQSGVAGYGLSATFSGFIMTLDNLAALLILPYVGALSDRLRTRFGRRKPFIAVGAPVAAVGFVAIPYALGSPILLFMLPILLTLLAMDLFRTPVIALMPDITPSPLRSQANGVINVMGGLGAVLAFAVGGALFKVSIHAPFLFGALLMLVGCSMVLLFIREPEPEVANPGELEPGLLDSFKQVLFDRDRSALLLLASIFFWFLSYTAMEIFFTSFAINELGVDSGKATQLLAFFSLSILAFSIPAGFLGGRLGRRKTITLGLIAFAGSLLWGSALTDVASARIMLVAAGISWSLVLVNSLPMVVDCAPESRTGSYTGLYYLASQSAAVVGPVLAGQLIELGGNHYRVIFPYGVATLVVALLLMRNVKRGEARDS